MAIIFMINLIMDRAKDLIGLKNKIEVAKNQKNQGVLMIILDSEIVKNQVLKSMSIKWKYRVIDI